MIYLSFDIRNFVLQINEKAAEVTKVSSLGIETIAYHYCRNARITSPNSAAKNPHSS